jgi:hypothetical protein
MHKTRPVRHYSMQGADPISDMPQHDSSHTRTPASLPHGSPPIGVEATWGSLDGTWPIVTVYPNRRRLQGKIRLSISPSTKSIPASLLW